MWAGGEADRGPSANTGDSVSARPDAPSAAETWDPTPPGDGSPEEEWLRWANQLPICRALGISCSELGDGRLTAVVEEPPLVANPNGSIHGGLQVAIADHCMGIAGATVVPTGHLVVTASVHASFHRPALTPATVRGRVMSTGRTLVHVEMELRDQRDRLCTSAHGAMAVLSSDAVRKTTSRGG